MMLPCAVAGAAGVLDLPGPPERARFVTDLVWRFYNSPLDAAESRSAALQSLLAWLRECGKEGGRRDTLPLPLAPEVWTRDIFGGRVTAGELATAIVSDRDAALLYYGLLALDDETRAWIATRPDLLRSIYRSHAAAFALVAPAFRVGRGGVSPAGGSAAAHVWEALGDEPLANAEAFLGALLTTHDGRLAWFYEAMSTLPPGQLSFALALNHKDRADRVAHARELLEVFRRVGADWFVRSRPFKRPAPDPALLLRDLSVESDGRPRLPGTTAFWQEVFEGRPDASAEGRAPRLLKEGSGLTAAWLCDRVFSGMASDDERRYAQVLFAARRFADVSSSTAADVLATLQGRGRYPMLAATLERIELSDPATHAAAVRHAAAIDRLEDPVVKRRTLATFQSIVALAARGTTRGRLTPDVARELVESLSTLRLDPRRGYDGAGTEWLEARLATLASEATSSGARASDRLIDLAIAPLSEGPLPSFEWEGNAYDVDLAAADRLRLRTLVDARAATAIDEALRLARGGRELADGRNWREAPSWQRALADAGARLGLGEDAQLGPDLRDDWSRAEQALDSVEDPRDATRAAEPLRRLADGLLSHGLTTLVYALATGPGEGVAPPPDVAATRHDFGLSGRDDDRTPWTRPQPSIGLGTRWRVRGSLLGLDLALAESWLQRVSSAALDRPPTLLAAARRGLTDTVVLLEPTRLTNDARDEIARLLARGRERASALDERSARALAAEIRLSPTRRSLLPWMITHEREALETFFSPLELLWAGLEGAPLPSALRVWGAAWLDRTGLARTMLDDPGPWEQNGGRWGTGVLISVIPDLQLVLGAHASRLGAPAALVPFLLGPATQDLADHARVHHFDDWHGMIDFIHGMSPAKTEEYLGLFTTVGPLIPRATTTENGNDRAALP